jgi:hypothetical protein
MLFPGDPHFQADQLAGHIGPKRSTEIYGFAPGSGDQQNRQCGNHSQGHGEWHHA